MKRIRVLKTAGSEQVHRPVDRSEPQCHLPKEELPGALLEAGAMRRLLRGTLMVDRALWVCGTYERVCLNHEYIVSGLCSTFVSAFEEILTQKLSYSSTEVASLKARAADVMPDIIGRLLYLRLHNIDAALNKDSKDSDDSNNSDGSDGSIFQSTPTIDSDMQLPTRLARAISNIGIFRAAGVAPGHNYVPTYSRDPGRAGGFADRCQSDEYVKLLPAFSKCGIVTSKVETRNSYGTSWYMLQVKKCEGKEESFKVIANFPVQSGNVSVTDAITRTYCLQPGHQWVPLESDSYNVREFLFAGDFLVGSNFGTVLEDFHPTIHPSSFMHVDMAKVPTRALKLAGLDVPL